MEYKVGSTDSSDLLIKLSIGDSYFDLVNLVPELDDEMVKEVIFSELAKEGLLNNRIEVYYTGANEWVIQSRCEALKHILNELEVVSY